MRQQQPPTNDAPPRIATWRPGGRGPARIYKHRAKGQTKQHPGSCIACLPNNVAGRDVRLRHGITLVLCEAHRTPGHVAGHGGEEFLRAISTLFHAMGIHSKRHHAALRAFVLDMCHPRRRGPERPRPGSYAWPGRRQDAETVWSRAGSFEQGRQAARAPAPDPRSRAPTERTVRRWWQERRWLGPPVAEPVGL
jgi:hypothetical protein